MNGGEVFQGTAVIERHDDDDEDAQAAAAMKQYIDFRNQRGSFAAST